MAQPTLNLTTAELRKEVMRVLGYGLSYQGLSAGPQDDVDRCIKRGLARFYAPEPIRGETVPHQWSFLVPRATLTTEADEDEYQLPENFGGMIDPFTWESNSTKCPIRVVSDEHLRRLAQAGSAVAGVPTHASIGPESSADDSPDATPDIPTRWVVRLWPVPDDEYDLTYRYYVVQDVVTSSIAPPGGGLHGETIIASCLSVAEEILNNRGGRFSDTYARAYQRRLEASVGVDRRQGGPTSFGINGDRSDGAAGVRETSVTYNGTQY